jgi:hypothetical protein
MQQYPLLSYRGVAGDFRNSVASFVVGDYRGIHTPTELENMYRVLAYKNELQDQEPLIQWPARFDIPAPLHREDFQ